MPKKHRNNAKKRTFRYAMRANPLASSCALQLLVVDRRGVEGGVNVRFEFVRSMLRSKRTSQNKDCTILGSTRPAQTLSSTGGQNLLRQLKTQDAWCHERHRRSAAADQPRRSEATPPLPPCIAHNHLHRLTISNPARKVPACAPSSI